jgi:hypothetical protein
MVRLFPVAINNYRDAATTLLAFVLAARPGLGDHRQPSGRGFSTSVALHRSGLSLQQMER